MAIIIRRPAPFVPVSLGHGTFKHELFDDGGVALDCGANIGVPTVEWAKAVHSWGRVLAIEARERIGSFGGHVYEVAIDEPAPTHTRLRFG